MARPDRFKTGSVGGAGRGVGKHHHHVDDWVHFNFDNPCDDDHQPCDDNDCGAIILDHLNCLRDHFDVTTGVFNFDHSADNNDPPVDDHLGSTVYYDDLIPTIDPGADR